MCGASTVVSLTDFRGFRAGSGIRPSGDHLDRETRCAFFTAAVKSGVPSESVRTGWATTFSGGRGSTTERGSADHEHSVIGALRAKIE